MKTKVTLETSPTTPSDNYMVFKKSIVIVEKSNCQSRYTMNEKVPLTASNKRKRELAREGDLLTYKRKRKIIDPNTVVPPNTVDSANEGVCEGVNISTESAEGVNIPQGSEFETESAQAGLGAQPPLPNVWPDFDENIPIFLGYSEGEGATSNDDVGPSDKSLLRSFRFYRARPIALGQEKLPIRVHHHQSTWDLRKEPQVVQDFVKLKGLDRIGAISYNYYNSALISAFVEHADATVIGGTWGFPAILEVFENNLLQDLKAFKSLKAGGAGNLLSLKKFKSHYAYKLEKVLSDGTAAAAKKKKGLTTRFVARAYILYVLGYFLFPTKKRTDVSVRYLVLFARDKVAKKWSWGSAVLAHMYYNLVMDICTFYFPKLGGIPKEMDSDAYEHDTCWKWDVSVTNRYGGTALLNFREALLEDVVWDPYRKKDSPHAFKEVNFFYGTLASLDHVQPYYPNWVVWQFNREQGIPTKRLLTEVSDLWNAKVARKFSPKYELIVSLAKNDSEIHQRKPASVNEHGDTPVHQYENIAEQYDASTSECDLLKETIEQMMAKIELKRVVDEQCALEFADLPRQLDANILERKNLEEKNTSLEAELRQKSGLEDCNQSLSVELNKKCKKIESLKAVNALLMEQIDLQLLPATPLAVLQSHQPVPDTTIAKKYEDLLAAHKDIKKKLIAKEDFKLVNAEERMKSLEANNSKWEVWRQALKKALASEGMGDMGDPPFEELFEQNERFFTIAQQGPKGDY
ncbi:hypothetical protein GIB67_018193 [Kingdonia uniflora]|uniref:Aminotransferase-like plant mobile domain-containing protein n=1 Tax=Kingdonia uniflora TaxID=39325 RepID=A0A7J7NMN3_9MAGN|nr:hypothetical protein GIB67_018193 [Kingdonia uniflora]